MQPLPKGFKIGAKVKSRTTSETGRIDKVRESTVGYFVDVNFAEKGKPKKVKTLRPSQLALV